MISSEYAQLFEGIHLEALKAKDVQNSSQVGPVDEKTPLTARKRSLLFMETPLVSWDAKLLPLKRHHRDYAIFSRT